MTATERKLSDTIREVKNAMADRDDVVVELREAQRTRLELLALELESVFADVPPDDVQFDLVISNGLQPRLWIDMGAHVGMGRDRRTYRFVRDTRLGRSVLAETPDIRTVADQVTRYIAERMIERQRMIDGAPVPIMQDQAKDAGARFNPPTALYPALASSAAMSTPVAPPPAPAAMPARSSAVEQALSIAGSRWADLVAGLFLVIGGALAALILLAILFWDYLPSVQFVR